MTTTGNSTFTVTQSAGTTVLYLPMVYVWDQWSPYRPRHPYVPPVGPVDLQSLPCAATRGEPVRPRNIFLQWKSRALEHGQK